MPSYVRTQGLNIEPTLSALTDNGHMRRPVSCDHERVPSAQGREEVLDAMDVDKGRRALLLQYAPVLGVNPWVEPQDVVLQHGQVRRQTCLAVHVHLVCPPSFFSMSSLLPPCPDYTCTETIAA